MRKVNDTTYDRVRSYNLRFGRKHGPQWGWFAGRFPKMHIRIIFVDILHEKDKRPTR